MKSAYSKMVWTMGLLGVSAAALAGEPQRASPQEPLGFISGGVIGAFAAGPVGAVIGAGIGTWLGNRVHRAGDAGTAEARAALLQADKHALETQNTALTSQQDDLTETNRALTARLDQLTQSVEAAQTAEDELAGGDAAKVLNGLQGDVLFRTGSAQIAPETLHGLQVLAQAVSKSPALQVRVDGFADPRGAAQTNLKLSEERAHAVRDVFLTAGVGEDALDINAYGSSASVADDTDGYALERRVRLTLQARDEAGDAEASGRAAAAAGSRTAAQVTRNH